MIAALATHDAISRIYRAAIRAERLLRADAPIGRRTKLIVEVVLNHGFGHDVHALVSEIAAVRRVEVTRRQRRVIHKELTEMLNDE